MSSNKIFPYICELSFGSPSHEAMNGIAFFIGMSLYTYEMFDKQETEVTPKQKTWCFLLSMIAMVLLFLFCVQGIFTGSNSFEEVIYGIEIGIYIALISHFYVKDKIMTHMA